jgi:hypothetical protein
MVNTMTKKECIIYFGGSKKVADAIGITKGSVTNWGEYPPKLRQLQIERLSGFKLKADDGIYNGK